MVCLTTIKSTFSILSLIAVFEITDSYEFQQGSYFGVTWRQLQMTVDFEWANSCLAKTRESSFESRFVVITEQKGIHLWQDLYIYLMIYYISVAMFSTGYYFSTIFFTTSQFYNAD